MATAKPARLLIYRFGQLGDTVAALPSLWALRRHFAPCRLTLLSEVPQADNHLPPERVLPPSGLIDNYLKYRPRASWDKALAFAGFMLSLRREKFDALVYLVPTMRKPRQRRRDLFFFRLAGFRRILGARGFPADAFPRATDGQPAATQNEADALLQRLREDGVAVPPAGQGCMDLQLTRAELDRAAALESSHRAAAPAHRGWVAICPGSKWPSKQWPIERYRELGRLLWTGQNLLPVVVGGREDREAGERLVADWGVGWCAAGELSVRESAALLTNAAFYVGNDTGVMHLAAAVRTPCVAVFSAQDWPGRWHPYGEGHRVLRLPVPCAGCMSPVCPLHLECLTGLDVAAVHEACLQVLAAGGNVRLPAPGSL